MNLPFLFRRARSRLKPESVLSILFMLLLAYVVVLPLFVMVRETFIVHPMERFQIPGSKAGDYTLAHWLKVLTGELAWGAFYKPLINTLIVSSLISLLSLLIGGGLAWLVVRTDLPWKKLVSNLAIIPYIMPSWSLALAWITLFKNQRVGGSLGLFEYLTGISLPNWFSYGMFPIVITLSLHYFPFSFMLIGGALRNIDSQLEESAELLGANRQQILRKIVFPLVAPVLFSSFLLTFSRGIGTFGTPAFLGGPVRFYMLSTMLYANIVGQRPGLGYIITLVMILFGALVLYMDQRMLGERKSFVTISGKGGMSAPFHLGSARTVVTLSVLVFLFLVTVIPFLILAIESFMLFPGNYSLSNLSLHYWIGPASQTIGIGSSEAGILRNAAILKALWNSVQLGILVALICGIGGSLIGYTIVRTRGTWKSSPLDQLSFIPYLIPSIGFGAIFLALFAVPRGPIPSLYGTLTLLVLAASVKYLPYSTRAGKGAILQIGPELEEAAIMSGAPWVTRIGRIIFPLQKAAFFSGLLLPFISAMRELSLVVLLATPGTDLATTITVKFTDRGWYPYTNGIMVLIVLTILLITAVSRKLMKTDLAKGIGG